MQYSKVVKCYETSAALVGRKVCAVHSEYSVVALRLDNDETLAFAVEEVSVGKWFEVFPLCRHDLPTNFPFSWSLLDTPFILASCKLLWREEWLEPAANDVQLMGTGPGFTQFVGQLGTAPVSRLQVVKVLAGIRFIGQHSQELVVCSSDSAPFKVDLAIDTAGVDEVMRYHTCE